MSFRLKRRVAAIAALTVAAVVTVAPPAYAAALTTVGWSTSHPQPSATNVRYTWQFTTASTGVIKYVTMTVPAGTTDVGALTVHDYYGLTIGTAALNTGTNTVTFTVTGAVSVAAGTSILISLSGFTNTSTATSFASVVTTQTSGPATIDTATAGNSVAFNSTATAVRVVVAQSTAFSSNSTGFDMLMDPSIAGLATQTRDVVLTVATNAGSGYTLRTQIDRLPLGGATAATIAAAAGTVAATATPADNTFGYTVSSSSGVGTPQGQIASNYAGYTVGSMSSPIFSATGPTNGDTITVRNQAKINYLQKADTYTAGVTYSVTPTY